MCSDLTDKFYFYIVILLRLALYETTYLDFSILKPLSHETSNTSQILVLFRNVGICTQQGRKTLRKKDGLLEICIFSILLFSLVGKSTDRLENVNGNFTELHNQLEKENIRNSERLSLISGPVRLFSLRFLGENA